MYSDSTWKWTEIWHVGNEQNAIILDCLQSLKQFFINVSFHIMCSQSYSDGSVLNRAIRVRLATSIWYGTLMKNCFKDWSQSTIISNDQNASCSILVSQVGHELICFCFVALRPKSTAMIIAGRSLHLTTLFSWASLNKQLTSNRAHTFACNWQQPFMNDSAEGRRMTVEIISWSISTKVWDRAGIKLATPWDMNLLCKGRVKMTELFHSLVHLCFDKGAHQ